MKNDELARAVKEIDIWKKKVDADDGYFTDDLRNRHKQLADEAIKIYKLLLKKGYSANGIYLITDFINKITEGKPLTPLTNDEDEWKHIAKPESIIGLYPLYKKYQNTRYNDLFKDVYHDGTVIYHDNNRVACYDPIMENYFSFGLVNKICDEIYPITMPYMPGDSDCEVQVFTFQYNQENVEKSDFDTVIVLSLHAKEGKNIPINRFFREPNEGETPTYGSWVEIDIAELKDRIDNGPMKNLDLIDLGLDGVYHNYIDELEEE